MSKRTISLDDKYTLDSGRVFLSGIQALVRLPMMQQRRDAAEGHETAGFISGYRGSPLGGYDQQLSAAKHLLEQHRVKFQPGVNEDLAATSCWGTQQAHLQGEAKYDGVFSIWYGKGPGVDRSGDAFRHGNLAGTAPLGGVLVLMGDDHTCESSTTAHQSEFALVDAMIPILSPAGVQEILDYGLLGWAMSRYSGCWVGIKCMKDTVEATATVEVDPARVKVSLPADFALPPGGLSIRLPDTPLEQEARLHNHKLDAVRAFARANAIDEIVLGGGREARIGIVTAGKSYLDVRQALDDLGLDEVAAARLGLRLYKVGMTWPLEPSKARAFAEGLDLVIVVEEKRPLIEGQLKELLYGTPNAPRIIGKTDERGERMLRSNAALEPQEIAMVIGRRLVERAADPKLAARVAELQASNGAPPETDAFARTPYFCSGCPHNSSTHVPEGSRAMAGIGCHFMASWMDRRTAGFTQMGGEGSSWIGEAPFSKRGHVFQNIGDGTYYHSGLLAIRACVAAGVNITYKILFNDAVAMTGGQRHDGPLTVPQITQQVRAEGVGRIAVVTDEPEKYPLDAGFAPGVTIHHRDELDAVQKSLREIPGATVLVYDQTCAAEKRRRRKRGTFPDPQKRAFINDLVCEGCGDCSTTSNCLSVTPLETEWGRKRRIDQSSCNKDFSCVNGFCPSFVTVHGGAVRKGKGARDTAALPATELPEPALPELADEPYGILVTGIGGTGVLTVGAIIGMAAHLDGKGCAMIDMTGLAQKGGAVLSHVRVARRPEDIHAVRLGNGGARLLVGCDLVVAGSARALATARRGATRAVVNTQETITGDFTRNPDLRFPGLRLKQRIEEAVGEGNAEFVEAGRLATSLLGDSIATNLFMLGYAYQKGLVPVTGASIERAIELNAAAVAMNKQAFAWGRRAALDLNAVAALAAPPPAPESSERLSESLDEIVERRVAFLTGYQDAAYAARYRALVDRVRAAEAAQVKGASGLAEAVARNYFKLLAYKDEYEVARLYTDGRFEAKLREQFEGDFRLRFHLAPPLFAERDPATGRLKKRAYGAWMFRAFKLLAGLKRLRGTPFDLFGYSAERKAERRLVRDYEARVEEILGRLAPANHAVAVELARLPEQIRGFGHIKEQNIAAAERREAALLETWRKGAVPAMAAE